LNIVEGPLSFHPELRDFRKFLYVVWKAKGMPDPTAIQYGVARHLQMWVGSLLFKKPTEGKETFFEPGFDRSLLEGFRGMGKSYISAALTAYCLGHNPRLQILVTSGSSPKAKEFTTQVQGLLARVEPLRSLIPRNPVRWSRLSFDVVGAEEAAQFASVEAKGIAGQVAGHRSDLEIGDDVETRKTADTQHQKEQLLERMAELEMIAKPGGKVGFLGTPLDADSVYNTLSPRGYRTLVVPARYPVASLRDRMGATLLPLLAKHMEEDPDLVGQPTEPLRFGEDDLLAREAVIGRSTFARQYQLDSTLSDLGLYPLRLSELIVLDLDKEKAPEKLVWCNDPEKVWDKLPNVGFLGDRYYRPLFISDTWREYTGSIAFIDPSGKGQDETAIAIVKILNGYLFCTAIRGYTGGYTEATLSALANLCVEHKVSKVLIESNFGDGMFEELLKPHLRRASTPLAKQEKGLLGHGITVEAVRHSTMKEGRLIDTLEPVLNQKRLVISKDVIEWDYKNTPEDSEDRGASYRFAYQLSRLKRTRGALKHDDRLEALAGAVNYWTERMAQDVDEMVRRRKEEDFDRELNKFVANALGRSKAKRPNWFSRLGAV